MNSIQKGMKQNIQKIQLGGSPLSSIRNETFNVSILKPKGSVFIDPLEETTVLYNKTVQSSIRQDLWKAKRNKAKELASKKSIAKKIAVAIAKEVCSSWNVCVQPTKKQKAEKDFAKMLKSLKAEAEAYCPRHELSILNRKFNIQGQYKTVRRNIKND